MKKLFSLLLSFSLILSAMLVGCGGASPLSFTSDFNSGSAPGTSFREVMTYDVKYVNDPTSYPSLEKAKALDSVLEENGLDFKGTFVTTFEVKPSFPDNLCESNIPTMSDVAEIYYYKTELSITSTYDFKGGDENDATFNDKVITETYFLPAIHSFAPIYSTYYSEVNLVNFGATYPFSKVVQNYSTVYNQANYTLTKDVTTTAKDSKGVEQTANEKSAKTHGYSFKTAIDNNMLLFALRNYKTDEAQSTNISVIAPAYTSAKSLMLSKHNLENVAIKYPTASDPEQTVSIRKFSMNVNETNSSGLPHYFFIQTAKTANEAGVNKALLVKYVAPIFGYGIMSAIGGLEYTLVSCL